MKSAWFLVGALLSLKAVSQNKHPVEPEDILAVRTVADAQIAPDGRHVAYTVQERQGDDRRTQIWIAAVEGSAAAEPVAIDGGVNNAPRWSPDGKTLAFLSNRNSPAPAEWPGFRFKIVGIEGRPTIADADPKPAGDAKPAPTPQLYLLKLDGSAARPLTNIPGGIKSFRWMPDGKGIAFLHHDTGTTAEREARAKKKDEVVAFEHDKFDRLFVYDLAGAEARLVTKEDINVADALPTPDGKSFVARVSPTANLNDVFYLNRGVLLDAGSGAVTRTLVEHGYAAGRVSPDGRLLPVLERSEKGILGGFPRLLDLRTGSKTEIVTPGPMSLSFFEWSADGRTLYGGADENTHTVLLQIDPKTGKASLLSRLPVGAERFTMALENTTVAFAGATPEHPPEVWVWKDGHAEQRSEHNPQVAALALGKTEETEWKSSVDGRTIHGVVIYPPDYQPGQRRRMVTDVHGGPLEDWQNGWLATWYCPAQMFASHGYVVLLPDPRGSEGGGMELAEANYRDWGGGDYQDIMDGVDAMVKRGIADPERLGIAGWSYGGYMTMWTVAHTGRFKAAMAGAGISDLRTMALTTDISPTYMEAYFPPVLKDPAMHAAHSAISSVDRVTTPLLMEHGAADERVPPSQSFEFFNALRFQNKEVMLVTYPREPHIFTERAHQIDSLHRSLAWFDKHLGQ